MRENDFKMSKLLRKYSKHLRALHRAKGANDRKDILSHCLKQRDFVSCISECCKNLVKGNLRLTPQQKKALQKKAKTIHLLASKKVPIAKKKKLIQSGGFLFGLLKPIISVLGGLFGGNVGA